MTLVWRAFALSAVLSAVLFAQTSSAPVLEGPRALTRNAAPRFGEQAELCGRAVALQCTDHFPRILMDVEGRQSRYVVAVPDWMLPDVVRRFDSSYLAHEVCATGTYTGYGPREGVELSNASDLIAVAGPDRPLPAFPADSVSLCDEGVTLPTPLHEVHPSYTPAAMAAEISGAVLIEGIVMPDGTVGPTRVIRSLGAGTGLDDEAVKAFKQWRLTPAARDGEPVPARVTVEMTFRLDRGSLR